MSVSYVLPLAAAPSIEWTFVLVEGDTFPIRIRRLMRCRVFSAAQTDETTRGVMSGLTGSNRTVEVHALRQTGRARVPIKKRRRQAGRYCASPELCTFERLCVSSVMCVVLVSCTNNTPCRLSKVFGVSGEKRTTQNGGLFNQFLTCGLSAHHMNTIHDSKSLHVHCAFTFLTITLARPRLLDKQSLQKSVFDAVKNS